MAVFAVMSIAANPSLQQRVQLVYPDDHYMIAGNSFLVSDQSVTAAQVCAKLGVGDGGISNTVVVGVSSYFGHASLAIWEWLKLKNASPS